MLKEHEVKEKARVKAQRKWNNAEVRKKVKEAQKEAKTGRCQRTTKNG